MKRIIGKIFISFWVLGVVVILKKPLSLYFWNGLYYILNKVFGYSLVERPLQIISIYIPFDSSHRAESNGTTPTVRKICLKKLWTHNGQIKFFG